MNEHNITPPLGMSGEIARSGPITPLERKVCLGCVRDWRADDTTLFCATCRWVDSLLAATGGSEHFLPHIRTTRLDEQPGEVLACALHLLQSPRDTGFYGIYTSMCGTLRRAGALRFDAAREQARAIEGDLLQWACSLRPSHVDSLTALTELAEAVCPPARGWLAARHAALHAACVERDAAASGAGIGAPEASDYDRITFARALR